MKHGHDTVISLLGGGLIGNVACYRLTFFFKNGVDDKCDWNLYRRKTI